MKNEFGSPIKFRFLIPTHHDAQYDWVYVLNELPEDGQRVICYGNKTFCCELDMQKEKEHEAIFRIKEHCWKEDANGNKYDIETYPCFEIDDDEYQLIFVSRWKKVKD